MKLGLAILASLFLTAQVAMARQDLSCDTPLGRIDNGDTVTGYADAFSHPHKPCKLVTVRCVNGSLLGSFYLFPTCDGKRAPGN
jgi:hypothetical protein